jgi:hypothetical protein
MPTRFLLRPLCLVCSLAVVLLIASPRSGNARPLYKKMFDSTYPDVAKANKTNCNLCHVGDDKKKQNHYGKALAKELKNPNVKDEKTIKEALKAIEDGDCRTGKWKERLDENKWPCACGDGGHDSSSYIARQLNRESR